jgi:8-hydroxy-5-deazaflavin:NADPH oxidoreductase
MKIGIFGGGMVAQTIGAKLQAKGHHVMLGIRNPAADELARPRNMAVSLAEWKTSTGAQVGTMRDAASHGDILFNCTQGEGSLPALQAAGANAIGEKILIDVANPLDFSKGMPPSLLPQYDHGTSLGEEIQRAFPKAKVVKAFNTITAAVMVDASKVPGDHDLLISGNDATAKATVSEIARAEFGWKSIVDLGDIVGARATEHLLPIWLRLWAVTGGPFHNVKIVPETICPF